VADEGDTPKDNVAAPRSLEDDAVGFVDSYDSKQFGGHLARRSILARSDSLAGVIVISQFDGPAIKLDDGR